MFYVLLVLVVLIFIILLYEVVMVYLYEEFNFIRGKVVWLVMIGCILLGIFCLFFLGVIKEFIIFGLGMFDLFDFVIVKLMLLLGGLFIFIFIGWYLDKKFVWLEIMNNGILKVFIYKLIIFILKYVVLIVILVIFINELGLLK